MTKDEQMPRVRFGNKSVKLTYRRLKNKPVPIHSVERHDLRDEQFAVGFESLATVVKADCFRMNPKLEMVFLCKVAIKYSCDLLQRQQTYQCQRWLFYQIVEIDHITTKNAERLQRELRNYITCMKALAQASRGYYEAVREVYDSEWTGSDHVRAISHSIELLWDEFCEKLIDQALNPLNSYCSQFVDLKGKIAKRGRKLVDYDSARHSYESVVGNGKKPDDVKVQKAQQELAVAKKLYDDINNELSEELPVLYDGRYTFFVNNLQSMFSAECNFHCDSAKLLTEIRDMITPKFNVVSHSLNHTDDLNSRCSLLNRSTTPAAEVNNEVASLTSDDSKLLANSPTVKKTTTLKDTRGDSDENNPFANETDESSKSTPVTENGNVKENNGETVKANSTTVHDVLYKVRASHRYTAEDTDELSFEAGEVILVVPYENPEDQDEGWLMGVLETTGQRGVFPVNFTKPL
ncbi:amphiphysin [Trichinella spiralis]|uniref:amphiphysin n=1 Tax=Trichinella spiralis TaxID=6334 RepID=UPI0001EFC142|nr:amphiphysin [Trichinella spiralis]